MHLFPAQLQMTKIYFNIYQAQLQMTKINLNTVFIRLDE